MVQRRAIVPAAAPPAAANYFTSDKDLPWVSSGCALLNQVLGGGYVLGRIVNIVGDKSSGKTLLAIEAIANFHRQYGDGWVRYAEAEAAFDEGYAEALGMPPGLVDFADEIFTVEDWFEDLQRHLDDPAKKDKPGLYIVDSLDALSDRDELARDIDKGTFGASKPKQLSEMFRRLIQRIEESKMLLVVISQIRDKIGVSFGEAHSRSGGRALDFYASQVIWLADIGKIDKEREGVKRITGINVRARCKKNKVGLPFRECEFPIIFGYGVDDLTANAEWLKKVGKLEETGLKETNYKTSLTNLRNKGGPELAAMREKLDASVKFHWARIEDGFLPKLRKY